MKWHCANGLHLQWLSPVGSERLGLLLAFRLESEAGESIPPSPVRLRRPIPAARQRLTGEGGVGEEA
jgi:hypothetical protein